MVLNGISLMINDIEYLHVHASLVLCDPMDCSPPGSSLHGTLRQEHWSRLPCPPSGDLPDSRIELASPGAPTLEAESLPLNHQESPIEHFYIHLLAICMSLLEKRQFRCSLHF